MITQTLERIKQFLHATASRSKINVQDLYPVLVLIPIAAFYFIAPEKFEVEWVGYSTLAFAGFFAAITWLVYRMTQPSRRINMAGAALSLVAISTYQLLVHGFGYINIILSVGTSLGFQGNWLASWTIAVDIAFYACHLLALTVSFFGLRSLLRLSAPIIYLFLMASAIILDDIYPSSSFTAFQIFIPYITASVGSILPLLRMTVSTYSLTDTQGQVRSILIVTEPRPLAVEINWPCAGIFSMLIFSAVMLSLLHMTAISRLRKTLYFTVGLLGTILVNIMRIVALIVFYVNLNADFLVFHQYIGGVFFVAWVTLFLSVIFLIEKRHGNQTTRLTTLVR